MRAPAALCHYAASSWLHAACPEPPAATKNKRALLERHFATCPRPFSAHAETETRPSPPPLWTMSQRGSLQQRLRGITVRLRAGRLFITRGRTCSLHCWLSIADRRAARSRWGVCLSRLATSTVSEARRRLTRFIRRVIARTLLMVHNLLRKRWSMAAHGCVLHMSRSIMDHASFASIPSRQDSLDLPHRPILSRQFTSIRLDPHRDSATSPRSATRPIDVLTALPTIPETADPVRPARRQLRVPRTRTNAKLTSLSQRGRCRFLYCLRRAAFLFIWEVRGSSPKENHSPLLDSRIIRR